MEPFGNHLRADEYICFPCSELFKEFVVAAFVLGGVGVEAEGADVRKNRMEGAFDLFRAGAFEFETVGSLTLGTL